MTDANNKNKKKILAACILKRCLKTHGANKIDRIKF